MPTEQGLITLGGLDFTDFAIPEHVRSSGPYQWIVHQQPGGARQLDGMGNNPDPYEWSGIFVQNDAEAKMILLNNMKKAGNPVILTYGGRPGQAFQDNVVIEDVTFHYLAPMRIEYAIKCIPITNGDNAAPAGQAAPQLPVGF